MEAPSLESCEFQGPFVLKRVVETCERAVGPEGPRPEAVSPEGLRLEETDEARVVADAAVGSDELTEGIEVAAGPNYSTSSDRGANTEQAAPGEQSPGRIGKRESLADPEAGPSLDGSRRKVLGFEAGTRPGSVPAAAAGSAAAAGFSASRSGRPSLGRVHKGIKGSVGAVLQGAEVMFQAELALAKAASLTEPEVRQSGGTASGQGGQADRPAKDCAAQEPAAAGGSSSQAKEAVPHLLSGHFEGTVAGGSIRLLGSARASAPPPRDSAVSSEFGVYIKLSDSAQPPSGADGGGVELPPWSGSTPEDSGSTPALRCAPVAEESQGPLQGHVFERTSVDAEMQTGAEFHNMAQREMHSLGAPTWEERCCQAGEHRGDSTSICSGWTRGQTTCWGQSSCATGAMPSTM